MGAAFFCRKKQEITCRYSLFSFRCTQDTVSLQNKENFFIFSMIMVRIGAFLRRYGIHRDRALSPFSSRNKNLLCILIGVMLCCQLETISSGPALFRTPPEM